MKWSLFCGRLSSTCWIVVDCCVDLMMLSFCWWCWCNLIVKQPMSNQIVEMPNCVWSIDFLMKCLKYFWCAVLCWFSRCLLWCYDVECYELAKSQKWLQMNFVWRKDSAENFERIVGGKKWWYFCAMQMCWFLMFATRGLVSVELLNLRLVDWFYADLRILLVHLVHVDPNSDLLIVLHFCSALFTSGWHGQACSQWWSCLLVALAMRQQFSAKRVGCVIV